MKMSWDLEKEVEQLTVELNSYRFENGAGRAKIRKEVARDCARIALANKALATANEIAARYGLDKAESSYV